MSIYIQNKALIIRVKLLNRSQKSMERFGCKEVMGSDPEERSTQESSEWQWGQLWVPDPCSPALEASGIFSGPCTGHQMLTRNKQTARYSSRKDGLFWDQQRIVNSGSANMMSHVQLPTCQMKNTFVEGKGSWEGYSKQRVHGFSLAEFNQERRGVFILGCFCLRVWELPLLVSQLCLIEVSVCFQILQKWYLI